MRGPYLSIEEEINDVKIERPHVIILGAGASRAAFENGDKNGNKLPLMNDLVEVLDLGPILDHYDIEYRGKNFEVVYSELFDDAKNKSIVKEIEDRVWKYFSKLEIPDYPTLYDHLVLSLREKDLIATFNWDPFLFEAWGRNYRRIKSPRTLFLHGNVALGFCMKDRIKGYVGTNCSKCSKPFAPSRLLFPIIHKNYNDDPLIRAEWDTLKIFLKNAYVLTIFGYAAPESDVEAIDLMKIGWGDKYQREYEEIEIIDVKPDSELRETWKEFIHTHHYQTCNYFYRSLVAKHPRRTCEAVWNTTMERKLPSDNNIPKDLDFDELWPWYDKLEKVEKLKKK